MHGETASTVIHKCRCVLIDSSIDLNTAVVAMLIFRLAARIIGSWAGSADTLRRAGLGPGRRFRARRPLLRRVAGHPRASTPPAAPPVAAAGPAAPAGQLRRPDGGANSCVGSTRPRPSFPSSLATFAPRGGAPPSIDATCQLRQFHRLRRPGSCAGRTEARTAALGASGALGCHLERHLSPGLLRGCFSVLSTVISKV